MDKAHYIYLGCCFSTMLLQWHISSPQLRSGRQKSPEQSSHQIVFMVNYSVFSLHLKTFAMSNLFYSIMQKVLQLFSSLDLLYPAHKVDWQITQIILDTAVPWGINIHYISVLCKYIYYSKNVNMCSELTSRKVQCYG